MGRNVIFISCHRHIKSSVPCQYHAIFFSSQFSLLSKSHPRVNRVMDAKYAMLGLILDDTFILLDFQKGHAEKKEHTNHGMV
jgi:hypothetical protein